MYSNFLNNHKEVREMAPWVTALAAMPGDLSSLSRCHMGGRERPQPPSCRLPHDMHAMAQTRVYKQINQYF